VRFSLVILTFAALSAACGQVLFKLGATGSESTASFINRYIIIGLVLYALGTAAWIYALSLERLTVAYAFTGLTFVLVYAAGMFFLNEKISVSAAMGVVLVFVGIYLIAVRSS
jgi:multidrug transporter EmrE-like cation transporter